MAMAWGGGTHHDDDRANAALAGERLLRYHRGPVWPAMRT